MLILVEMLAKSYHSNDFIVMNQNTGLLMLSINDMVPVFAEHCLNGITIEVMIGIIV